MNDEEMDVYIKSKIKDGYIPERIDNLFNNSVKIIENKGEKQMEVKENENIQENTEINNNNQKKPEKKKMPVALKRVLATAACLTVVLGGGNLYATSQGYDNIFFLIKHIITGEDVRGKDNILSDKDITISYRPIEIAKGTQIQVNSLVIKNSEAKLKIKVNEVNAQEVITPLTYIVKDERGTELCNYKSTQSQVENDYQEELILKNYQDTTKKLQLEIFKNDTTGIVTLEIDLENKEINVIGNQEPLTKISEEELKEYLGGFAMLSYKGTEYRDFSKDTIEVENARKMIAALQIAKINNIDLYTGEKLQNDTGYTYAIDRVKMNNLISSFTSTKIEKDDVLELSGDGEYLFFESVINGKHQYFYTGDTIGFAPTCLEVTDISYINGIYNVIFKFCYSTEENKGFNTTNTVEDLPIYEMSMGLILDEDNEYSKYRVSSMSEVTWVVDESSIEEPVSNENAEAKKIIQGFLNVISSHEGSTVNMLQIEEIGLIKDYEEWTKISNANERDDEGYIKTHIKYSDLKDRMLKYMTEDLFKDYSYGYKNINDVLWVLDVGSSGGHPINVKSVKEMGASPNIITYEVVYGIENYDGKEVETMNRNIELQKNENGKYVVSSWGVNEEQEENAKYKDYIGGSWVCEEDDVHIEMVISDINDEGITFEVLSYREHSYEKQTAKFMNSSKTSAEFHIQNDANNTQIGGYIDLVEDGIELRTIGTSNDINIKSGKIYRFKKHIKHEDYVKTWKDSDGNFELKVSKADLSGMKFEIFVKGKSYGTINKEFSFETASCLTPFSIGESGKSGSAYIYLSLDEKTVKLNLVNTGTLSLEKGVYTLQAQ